MVKKKTSTSKSKKASKKNAKPKGYQVVGGAKLKDKEIKTSREKMIGQHIGYRYDVNLIPDYKHLTPFLKQYIDQFRKEFIKSRKTDALFLSNRGTEMTRHSFWHILKKYAVQVGINEHLSPHTLRHAFATHMINNGADLRVVQLLLGHSDLSTTQLYTHIAKNELKELHCKNHPRA